MEFALNRQLKSLSSKLVWSIAAIGMTALAASSAATPRVLATSTKTNHPVCALVASPNGRDKNSGSRRSPLATVSKLVATLRPGQTGCLLSGRFEEDVKIIRKGTRARPFTLRSAPHAKATICGAVEVASPAEYWRLARLNFDGSCSTANTVMIFGDHITVAHSDITNRRDSQSCVYIGNAVYGRAHAVVLHYNRIHGCGKGDSRYFHGIYADAPRNARITDDYIYENAGFGIHLYPDAQGTIVERNVVDDSITESGLVFGGDDPYASSHNLVMHNIFSGNGAYGISSSWGTPVGTANIAIANCFWRNARGAFDSVRLGYLPKRSVYANPLFMARDAGDYRLRPGSRCAMMQPHGHVGP